MIKLFNKFINVSIFLSIIFMILGLLFVFMPNITLRTFSMFVSIYLMIHGIFLMVLNIRSRNLFFPIDTLVPGVLSLILGIVLLLYPDTLRVIIPIFLGIFIIIHSISNFNMIIGFGNGIVYWNYIISILLVIIQFILGIVVIINPLLSAITLTMFIGAIIFGYALVNLIDMIILKKNIRGIVIEINGHINDVTTQP